jgi:DNA polymerase III epsilon subunit-like protein
MPIILVFDTETTGFPPYLEMIYGKTADEKKTGKQLQSQLFSERSSGPNLASWSQWSPKWNNIIQISYILYDTKNNIFTPFDDYIDLPPEVVEKFLGAPKGTYHPTIVNALEEQQKATEQGKTVPLQDAIERFLEAYKSADIVVGHNVDYDKSMVLAELMHLHLSADNRKYLDKFIEIQSSKKFVCTSEMGVDVCKIEARNSTGDIFFKFPRLNQLYEHLFGYPPVESKLHNALNDVIVTFRCYYFITYDEDIYGKNTEIDELIKSITPIRLLSALGKGLKKSKKSKKYRKSMPGKKSKKSRKSKSGKKVKKTRK